MRRAGTRGATLFPDGPSRLQLLRQTFPMQALFLISLGATCLGGAIALGALFHCFSFKPTPASVGTNEARVNSRRSVQNSNDKLDKLDELERRERAFSATCRRVNDELDAKRQALEALTLRANEAAEALGRALDSVSFTFGTNTNAFRTVAGNYACVSAAPFELNDFDARERQAKAA